VDLASFPNGGLIRAQPIDGAPDAAAYRILYRSEGLSGQRIAVFGRRDRSGGPSAIR
jgi:hypothetical protein